MAATQAQPGDTTRVQQAQPDRSLWLEGAPGVAVDYRMKVPPADRGCLPSTCVPVTLGTRECMTFQRRALRGLLPRPTTDSTPFRAYCFPPQGLVADSLVVYLRPCGDSSAIQVRLYDTAGTLIEVLPLGTACPGTCALMRHHITTPRRRYTLEIVGYGTRLVRPIILGR
jgi:hypothetical protein